MNELLSEWKITEGHLDVVPEEVGLSSHQLNKLDNHFLNLIAQKKFKQPVFSLHEKERSPHGNQWVDFMDPQTKVNCSRIPCVKCHP